MDQPTLTRAEKLRARAEANRIRKQTKAEQRRRDRELVTGDVARILGLTIAEVAQAMRNAGVNERLTAIEAKAWADGVDMPEWLGVLHGERMACAAQEEHRKQQAEKDRQLRRLMAEEGAVSKVRSGAHRNRFSSEEWAYVEGWAFRASKWLLEESHPEVGEEAEAVLRLIGVKVDDHRTWWLHVGGCDQQGAAPCGVRLDEMRAERRAEALIESVAKETALRDPQMRVGAYVTAWSGRRIGQIVKINKVSVKVRMIGSREDGHVVTEKKLDPRHISVVPGTFRAVPEVDSEVVLRDHGGYTRSARVVSVDGPLFEATYSIKSGEWRSAWFDVLCLKST